MITVLNNFGKIPSLRESEYKYDSGFTSSSMWFLMKIILISSSPLEVLFGILVIVSIISDGSTSPQTKEFIERLEDVVLGGWATG